MPGLYFHIPFCRKACTYCNFHFSTSRRGHDEMVATMVTELHQRHLEMPPGPWTTVYFGGGTPSLLSAEQIDLLLTAAQQTRGIAPGAEITLEANPDDLSIDNLSAFAKTHVNRLSIGVQSFRESDLAYMHRAHDASQALRSILDAQTTGFHDLTIDLIYGTPGLDDEAWRENLATAVALNIPHISAYALTVEPKTALAHDIRTGRSAPVDDEQSARQMDILIDTLVAAGYEQYEVSNFALPNHSAQHNSNYWRGVAYLGIGPSAHSFDGSRLRSWNLANNARYVQAIGAGELPIEREELSAADRYNELLLTGLRTSWGVSLEELSVLGFRQNFLAESAALVEQKLIERVGEHYRLTRAGRMQADGLSAALFVV